MSSADRDYWLRRAAQCRASAAARDEAVRRRLLEAAETYQRIADAAVPTIVATFCAPAAQPDSGSAPLFKRWFARPSDRAATAERDTLAI